MILEDECNHADDGGGNDVIWLNLVDYKCTLVCDLLLLLPFVKITCDSPYFMVQN